MYFMSWHDVCAIQQWIYLYKIISKLLSRWIKLYTFNLINQAVRDIKSSSSSGKSQFNSTRPAIMCCFFEESVDFWSLLTSGTGLLESSGTERTCLCHALALFSLKNWTAAFRTLNRTAAFRTLKKTAAFCFFVFALLLGNNLKRRQTQSEQGKHRLWRLRRVCCV